MSRPVIVAVTLLLAGALALVVWKGGTGSANNGTDRRDGARAGFAAARDGSAKSARTPTRSLAVPNPGKRLREILEADATHAPDLEAMDNLARRLSDEELQELILEVGFGTQIGVEGWVRSALYAEWGRRDPQAALARLRYAKDIDASVWATQQALFAVYRGWAEIDPAAAVLELRNDNPIIEVSGQRLHMTDCHWIVPAYAELFRRLVAVDPEAAWSQLPTSEERLSALAGIFQGAPSERQLRAHIDRWIGEWNTAAELPSQVIFEALMENGGPDPVLIPENEQVVRQAALALARFDLEAAEEWIRTEGPGGDRHRQTRRNTLVRDWSVEFPDRAMDYLDSDDRARIAIARAIIETDTGNAMPVMETLPDEGDRARALMHAITGLGVNDVLDYFPTTAGRNILPDFNRRYQDLADAIEAGNFSESHATSLRGALNRSFRLRVDAAREAFEGSAAEANRQ